MAELSTYRHLRLAMAFLLGLLLVAVALRAFSAPGICFEGSISAYYFTSVRAVFVAALCALGTCLIVYRGNTDAEDIALNASGILAFVVAFVPTGVPASTGVTCSASNVPGPGQLEDAVNNNMVALILMAAVTLAVALALVKRSTRKGKAPRRALVAFGIVLVLGSAVFALWPAGFREHAHITAAVGTFIGIVAVVGLNAFGAQQLSEKESSPTGYRNAYVLIALAMIATAAIIGIAHWQISGWRHGVLLIEAALLIEFMVFWLVQTRELWTVTRRADLAA